MPVDKGKNFTRPHMNVIFMGNFLYPKGMAEAKRIQHFVDYLVGKSVDVKVLLLRQGGVHLSKTERKGSYKGVPYKTIGNGINLDMKLAVTLPAYFICGITTLLAWRQAGAKNILYCYNGLDIENVVLVLAGKLLGYHVVFDIVEDFTHFHEKTHAMGRFKHVISGTLSRFIGTMADALVVISHYLLQKYEQRTGKEKTPVILIPISAQCSNSKKKSKGNPVKIVYSGSFAEKDGVRTLLAAFERLQKTHENCILLMTGKGSNLSTILDRISNNDAIKYVGYLNDKEFYTFLCEADVLCITRDGSQFANAGFPYKLGEYLATGNPVVVSNVGDVPRYLENMQDAILVEPENVEQVHNALQYCIDNYDQAKMMGENGRRKCEKYFNPHVNGQKLLELFDTF
jgi:glycosyltransferase involved in cell wall biosynthesis